MQSQGLKVVNARSGRFEKSGVPLNKPDVVADYSVMSKRDEKKGSALIRLRTIDRKVQLAPVNWRAVQTVWQDGVCRVEYLDLSGSATSEREARAILEMLWEDRRKSLLEESKGVSRH